MTKAKADGPGFHTACRDTPKCRHKKHGWGKKRRHEVLKQTTGWQSPNKAQAKGW